ncbi:hypothetical protein ENUP19_0280G0003 [Entamoeba nuttalli]|uniref:Rab5-interacting protein n=2 Tax=Entamoeba nuttalli TaxID=412467 RepID=K2GX22_ENTNP|nr:hypothetical protein ENU1_115980 [Entamoeba nuttalli P19]EKE39748.1 hypothetical protein ENU1_115980 [Entamoeba nuttalli P19]|eukprot:XP_008857913.1 hypothetical protein ENU1_115980 [Entamoeba nuttalli P19]
MSNIFDPDYEWTKKTVCHAIFTIKSLISPIVGIICGIIGIQGWLGFAICFGCVIVISYFFVVYYSLDEIDPEVTLGDAINEGLGVSLAEFLLFWIIFFTMFHSQ